MLDIVAAILNLGNVNFFDQHKKGLGSCAHISAESEEFALKFQKLMGLKDQKAVEDLLCTKVNIAMDERIVVNLQAAEAQITRDSVAKFVYKKLFTWLVAKVNSSISIGDPQLRNSSTKFIGILDIFGFEIFEHNSFEQLMINFANEKLQNQFNLHMFAFEQEEYKKEKIKWDNVEFVDNLGCIDLIESQTSASLFKILDEECMINGTADSLLRKLND